MVHIEHDVRLGFSASLAALNGSARVSFLELRDDFGSNGRLVVRAVDAGGNSFGAPVVIAESDGASLTYLGTCALGEDTHLAVWTRLDLDLVNGTTATSLLARVFDRNGARGDIITVACEPDGDGDLFEGCDVAPLGDGGVVIAWPRFDGILARRIDADGAADAVIVVNRLDHADLSEQSDPRVAPLSNGGFVVVWTDAEHLPGRDGYSVFARQFDAAGDAVGETVRVNRLPLPEPVVPRVTQIEGGRFVISWTSSTPPSTEPSASLLLNAIITPDTTPADRVVTFHDGSAGAVVAFRLPESDAVTRIVSLGGVAITSPIPSPRALDISMSWQVMGSILLVPLASLEVLWSGEAEARELLLVSTCGIGEELRLPADFLHDETVMRTLRAPAAEAAGAATLLAAVSADIAIAPQASLGRSEGDLAVDNPTLDPLSLPAAVSATAADAEDLADAAAVVAAGADEAVPVEPEARSGTIDEGPPILVGSDPIDPPPPPDDVVIIIVGHPPGDGVGTGPGGDPSDEPVEADNAPLPPVPVVPDSPETDSSPADLDVIWIIDGEPVSGDDSSGETPSPDGPPPGMWLDPWEAIPVDPLPPVADLPPAVTAPPRLGVLASGIPDSVESLLFLV